MPETDCRLLEFCAERAKCLVASAESAMGDAIDSHSARTVTAAAHYYGVIRQNHELMGETSPNSAEERASIYTLLDQIQADYDSLCEILKATAIV